MWWIIYTIATILGIAVAWYFTTIPPKQSDSQDEESDPRDEQSDSQKKELGTQKKMIAWFTLFITVLGILLAISDEFLSQYNYDPQDIWQALTNRDGNVHCIMRLKGLKEPSPPPKIFFIVDISGSMGMNQFRVPIAPHQRNELNELIKQINNAGVGHMRDAIRETENRILPACLVRIWLWATLADLRGHGRGANFNFSIITFAGEPNHSQNKSLHRFEDFRAAFNKIRNLDFNGRATNFFSLFSYLENELTRRRHNPFSKSENVLFFLSDFFHEPRNNTPAHNNPDSINVILQRLERRSIFFNMKVVNNEGYRPSPGFIPILDIVQDVLPLDRHRIVDILKEPRRNITLSEHLAPRPLRFYYRNRLHEDSIATSIYFSMLEPGTRSYRFSLRDHNRRQHFQIHSATERDAITLTTIPVYKQLNRNDTVHIMMRGQISAQQFSPILHIKTDHHAYNVGIVFHKEFSIAGRILAFFLLGMLLGIPAVPIINWMNKQWEKLKDKAKKRWL